jgi:hypothetical protein
MGGGGGGVMKESQINYINKNISLKKVEEIKFHSHAASHSYSYIHVHIHQVEVIA